MTAMNRFDQLVELTGNISSEFFSKITTTL